MSGFSDYLQNFINLKNITLKDLSEETNIDRTVLYRYVKGKRIPSDKNIVVRMADVVQMSVSEKKHLLEEYDKLILGENIVYSYEYIQRIIHSLERLRKNKLFANNMWNTVSVFKMENMVIELNTKEDIITYILDLFKYIASRKRTEEKILLLMQPGYGDIQRFIPQIFGKCSIEIEQIICMEQNINQSYKNLELFEKILPLCFSLLKYNLYYYYDSVNNHINNMTTMPNIIIVDDYVVQFDYKMKNGVVIKNKIFAKIMSKQYYLLKRETHILLMNNKESFFKNIIIENIGKEINICLHKQLCICNCMSRNILERHIHIPEGKEYFIDKLLGIYSEKDYMEDGDTDVVFVSYGTVEGMEDFMKSGHIEEFPDNIYSPLSVEERLMVLERMILEIKEGRIICRLISDNIKFADGIIFYLSENKKQFALSCISDKSIMQMVIDEQSIYRTFKMYLEYLEKKGVLYSKEETLRYLENLMKKIIKNIF